jgi:transposase IS116/IS110/IS902 family protein
VNVIVASTFLAAVGDIRRFPGLRLLVGYLGLDPRVRQSGPGPAKHGDAGGPVLLQCMGSSTYSLTVERRRKGTWHRGA